MTNPNSVTVSQVSDVTTVEITTQGPQGPAISGVNFDITGKVDNAVLYYHADSDTIKQIILLQNCHLLMEEIFRPCLTL